MAMIRTMKDVEERRIKRIKDFEERKANQTFISPAFVSAYVSNFQLADSDFFRYMFPISGTLQHGLIFLDFVAGMKKILTMRAGLVGPSGGSFYDFTVKEGYNRIKPSIPIPAGTRLALGFINVPEKMEVRGIWIGFTFATQGVLTLDEDVEALEIDENA